MLEPGEVRATADLLDGLCKRTWARPVLYALADGPLRHRDLLVTLTATAGKPVYSKTLGESLRYLEDNSLVIRQDSPPRTTVYSITDYGLELLESLRAVDRVVHDHQSDAGP